MKEEKIERTCVLFHLLVHFRGREENQIKFEEERKEKIERQQLGDDDT